MNIIVRTVLGGMLFAIIVVMWGIGFASKGKRHSRLQWSPAMINDARFVTIYPYTPFNYNLEETTTISSNIIVTDQEVVSQIAREIASGKWDRKLWKNPLVHWTSEKYVLVKIACSSQDVMFAVKEHTRYPLVMIRECYSVNNKMRWIGDEYISDKVNIILNDIATSNKVSWVRSRDASGLYR